ncbi:MAG: response regulator transcription factor [Candidatus Thiodiazotropha sp.]
MIRVYIADDHQILREGIRRIIEGNSNMVVCGEAEDGETLTDDLSQTSADVLILDISMPGPGLIETLRRVERTNPNVKVLVLSAHAEEQYAKRALKAGAKGYLTKNHSPEELVNAIIRISNGRKYISQTLAELLLDDSEKPEHDDLHQSLSQREYQVMCLLGSGKSVVEIADELSLSSKTVSAYRSRILEKLALKNNAEIIYYAIQHKLVE